MEAIITNQTFALRLLDFVSNVQVCDLISEEEKNYLLLMGKNILEQQVKTASGLAEEQYIENNQKHITKWLIK
jgi:hypothetical protein